MIENPHNGSPNLPRMTNVERELWGNAKGLPQGYLIVHQDEVAQVNGALRGTQTVLALMVKLLNKFVKGENDSPVEALTRLLRDMGTLTIERNAYRFQCSEEGKAAAMAEIQQKLGEGQMIIPAAFIAALILVESGGNDAAIGAQGELGPLQIKVCVLADVNAAIRRPNFYKPKDRLNRAVSEQILRRYLARWATREHLGRKPTLKDMALIWHRGPTGWKKPDKDHYWVRVQKAMREEAK